MTSRRNWLSCFGGRLREKVEWCLRYWVGTSEARRVRALTIVDATKDWDWLDAATLSLMYPTAKVDDE
ncbi:hypothetical protein AUG19_03240 [archaeon 13_1_20CM_2_54_9]|nr:MAG: hypothetical protein AUG19_03240 [archaeon 13_1_20CM_2_54_9]